MINRQYFYRELRRKLFPAGFKQETVDAINVILDKWDAECSVMSLDRLAYMLATAYHETNRTMQAVMETRQRGEDCNPTVDQAIARLEASWKAGKLPWVKTPYWRKDKNGRSWLGRGLVQLTHKTNYERIGKVIGVDLVVNPELALNQEVAVEIMFAGMEHGLFTGADLDDFLDGKVESEAEDKREFMLARKIINGIESREIVAGYAIQFQGALRNV
jgi:predicted chitinase